MAPNSTSEKVSLGTNLTVLELKFLYYLHVLHTLTKSCFDITDIITTSVFIIIQAVENVGLSCAQCCICLTYVGELFLFVCLFVCFLVVFHSSYGLATCLGAPQQNHQLLTLVTTVSHVKSSLGCKSPGKLELKLQ